MLSRMCKGLAYEHYVYAILLHEGWSGYMWQNIPLNILQNELNLTSRRDHGCDIFMKNSSSIWTIIQCKNYARPIGMNKCAGFWYMLANRPHMNGLLITNAGIVKWLESDMSDRIKHRMLPWKPIIKSNIDK